MGHFSNVCYMSLFNTSIASTSISTLIFHSYKQTNANSMLLYLHR